MKTTFYTFRLLTILVCLCQISANVFAEKTGEVIAEKSAAKDTNKDTAKKSATKTEKKVTQKQANPKVELTTSMGNIVIELDQEKAPISTKNFIDYVEAKHYDGTIFHRVINNFMIQGGGMTENMSDKPTRAPIKNEAGNGLKNLNGTVAMARTNQVDSATSQFFINVKDNDFLDHKSDNPREFGYAVFGKVVSGMDVVEKIKKVPTTTKSMHENVPREPVTIKTARVLK